MSQENLADAVGMSRKTVQRYEKMEGEPDNSGTVANLRRTAEVLGVRYEWLVSGEPPKKAADEQQVAEPEPSITRSPGKSDIMRLRIHHKIKAGASNGGHINYETDVAESESHEYSRELFKHLLGFSPPPDLEGVYVTGHSMEPGLQDDQLVLYKPVSDIVSGKRYVVHLYDPMTADWYTRVKRLDRIVGGGLRIISDNPRINDTVCTLNEHDKLVNEETGRTVDIRIIGRVLWPREDTDAAQMDYLIRAINHYIDKP